MTERYIDATQEAGAALFRRNLQGPIVMLNLLKFRETADYSNFPALAPATPISGADAYAKYIEHTLPFLNESGGEVLFRGTGGPFVIGPQDASWDLVLLVKHQSMQRFMAFASNEGYLKGAGHRTAALLDARLLPMQE
ncbi:MAG: DUF1330 domain-containing protein [Bacteroidota bacterium]